MAGSSGGLLVGTDPRRTGAAQQQPTYGTTTPLGMGTSPQATQPMQNFATTYQGQQGTQGMGTTYTPYPNVATTQYQTTPTSTLAQQWSQQTGIPASQYTGTQPGSTMTGGTQTAGQGSLSQGAYEGQQQDQLRAMLSNQAFASRLAMLQPYTGSGQAAHVDMSGMSPDEAAARAAAFARAKEQAGGTALAALKGLQDSMASRGLMGSTGRGFESGGIGDIIGGAAGGINEFSREQLLQDLNRYADIANTRYKGDIEQRGQDLDAQRAILGLMSSNFNLF